jgi:hypothetical protein
MRLIAAALSLSLALPAAAADPLPITIFGLPTDNVVKVTRPSSDFKYELLIASTHKDAIELTVTSPDFSRPTPHKSPSRRRSRARSREQSAAAPERPRHPDAAGSLPVVGVYTGSVTLSAAERASTTVMFQVTRTRTTATAQFKDVVPAGGPGRKP